MRTKKMRGLKRKTRNLLQRIEEETLAFPLEYYNDYWNLKLPVAQDFISSSKTPYGIKKLAIKTLLDKAEHFVRIKPRTPERLRVVVMIESPGLWNSQIIVFSGDSHFEGFFDRNDEFQKWIPINVERSFEKEWDIKIPDPMKVLGFKEEINDEDGYIYKGELWFIGEII